MWQPLRRFDDPKIPKLYNLARADAAGIRVPMTAWAPGADAPREPPPGIAFPLIIRSGSPTEDTHETSNAGQLLSLVVRSAEGFAGSAGQVIAALPADARGVPLGVVFVQPLVKAAEAGVAFFDGFYYERTTAAGGNEALTSGNARGDVARGHLARGDAWSTWLGSVYEVFAGDIPRIDIELARDDEGYILLQARPALFPVARSETLSLANHKEILGDPPSPWIVSVLSDVGREVLEFFAEIDPAVRGWDEGYSIDLGERAWMNFSFFFRLMDRWGLPRSFVTQGVGGEGGGPEDNSLIFGRFLANSMRLLRLQWHSLKAVLRAPEALAALDREIEAATSLTDLYRANVSAMALAIRTNFAIGAVLSGVSRVRRAMGIEGTARVVTEDMMHRYQAIASLGSPKARARALDDWLATYGHRGPLESDPARPRFCELRDLLLQDLESARAAGASNAARSANAHLAPRNDEDAGLFFWIDQRREWFRDELMKRWKKIRDAALGRGGELAAQDRIEEAADLFQLRGPQIEAVEDDPTFDAKAAVRAARERREAVRDCDLPLTASRHTIEQALAAADRALAVSRGKRLFPGIPLGPAVVTGTVLRAHDLTELLASTARSGGIPEDAILVVGALEPSWAVVFPRFRGVIAEIGGELSHASILLREAKKPAIVNCKDIFRGVATGDVVRLDGARGVVEVIEQRG